MAKTEKFPTNREQKLAWFLAQGLTSTEAARRAGYAQSTIRSNAYLLLQRPHIQKLVSSFRQSLGLVDADFFSAFIAELKSMAGNEALPARDRFAAINRMIAFYEDFRQNRNWQAGVPAYLFTPLEETQARLSGTNPPSKYPSKPTPLI